MQWFKGRWQLITLLALFFVPTFAAMVMVFSDWRPDTFSNNGDLVQPAEQINPEQWDNLHGELPVLAGDWLLVMPQRDECGQACLEVIDQLQRIRVALDRSIDRVQMIVLQPASVAEPVLPAELAAEPGIFNMAASAALVDRLSAHEGSAMAAHIVDYRGFHVLRYTAPLDASALLDDLEKLLRLAKEEAERRAFEEAVEQ